MINSINFFKRNIKPCWEDAENKNGGRLVFQIERQQENYQDVYEALVFYFLGEAFPNNNRINGIRFITAKEKMISKIYFRVEIWVDYNEKDFEKVKDFRDSFFPFLEEYSI